MSQQEIIDFMETLDVNFQTNVPGLIPEKTLFLYCPKQKVVIEYNSNEEHLEEKVGKNYHQEIVDECLKKDILVYHIFSDEWTNKKDIIKSMIKHRLKLSSRHLMARKCKAAKVPSQEGYKFFNETHISGKGSGGRAFGLYYEDELVMCVSFKKPIQKKYENCIEIARFSTKHDTHIAGGFQKLFKFALKHIKEEGFKTILTYADMRFSQGEVYKKAGFEDITPNKPNVMYWYTGYAEGTNFNHRFFRFKYRAQKNPKKTEKQVAEEARVWKIFGTGNKIYKMTL